MTYSPSGVQVGEANSLPAGSSLSFLQSEPSLRHIQRFSLPSRSLRKAIQSPSGE
jgi:hypothetical protein